MDVVAVALPDDDPVVAGEVPTHIILKSIHVWLKGNTTLAVSFS
jgi:hypothetical protein